MSRLSNNSKKIILNLIYLSFVFSLVHLLGLGIGLDLSISIKLFIIILISGLVKFFLFNPLALYILLILGLIIATIVHYYYIPVLSIGIERAYFLFDNIINNLRGKENITSDNLLLFWGLLIVLVSLYTAYILFKNKNIYFLLPVYFFSFLYYWYNYMDDAYWMMALFLLGFLTLTGIKNYFKLRKHLKYNKEEIYKRLYSPWIKTVVLYSVIIVIGALWLPKINNYFSWPWLQDKVYTFYPNVVNLRSYESFHRGSSKSTLFSFSSTGFQEDPARLGGPVKLSNKKIMTVFADSTNYLRGNVKHIYNGDYWRSADLPYEDYGLKEDFSNIPPVDKRKYYNREDITIKNKAFSSTTVFSPYKAESMTFNSKQKVYVNYDSSILFPNGIFQDESYAIKFQKPKPYGVLMSLGIDERKENIDKLQIYLQIPEDRITDRTKSLVRNIVNGKDTDFEKAVAIENYLRNNFDYNLDVEIIPENQEFIDYFLFDGKEGYCTYYATAMAIMLRLEGIPSRYVEGYLVHEEIDPGVYEVSHSNAHTWVEAFIQPVGWITFEPTPAFPVENRMEAYRPTEQNIVETSNRLENQDRVPILSERDLIIDEGGSLSEEKVESEFVHDSDNILDLSKIIPYILFGALLLILPLRFLIGFLHHKYKDRMSKKLDNDQRIIYLYQEIMNTTKLFGLPQKHGETHYEYANRVAYKFYYQNQSSIKEVTDIFVRSKYSGKPTIDEDVLMLEEFRKTLDKHLRNSLGIATYCYCKYIKK